MSKRLSLCCALLCASAIIARADDNKPITNSGASNLMFSFGGLSSLAAGPFLTASSYGTSNSLTTQTLPLYGVGYRYFIANELALRASLGLAIASTTTKGGTNATDATDSKTAFVIGAGIEKHMVAASAVDAHMGALIGFLTGSHKNTPSHATTGKDQPTTFSGSDFSIAVYAGAEWFFNSAMSFGAEYQFGFVSSSSSAKNTLSDGTEKTTTGPSQTAIGTNTVNAILNVYIGR